MAMPLKSIEEEAADCRAAFKGFTVGTPAWHVHHAVLCEIVTEPIENRISYILSHKAVAEQALRLRLMRPAYGVAPALAEYKRVQAAALAEYERVKAPALAENKRVTAAAWAEQYVIQQGVKK